MRENGRSEINQFHFTRKLSRQSSILENGMYHISKEEVKQCSNEEPFRFLQCSFVQLRHSPFTFPVVKESFHIMRNWLLILLFNDDPIEDEEEEEIPEEPEVPELELNGKSDLSDVRQLLRAWIKHCPCPSKGDVMQIVEFLKRKLLNQNDEFVYLLLKTVALKHLWDSINKTNLCSHLNSELNKKVRKI